MTNARLRRSAVLGLAIGTVVGGCADSSAGDAVGDWITTTREVVAADPPQSDLLQREPNKDCELVDRVEFLGEPIPHYGSGTALFGEVGTLYQCTWSGADTGTAIVRLEVVLLDDREDFDDYSELVASRDGNARIETDVGEVQIASTVPDGQRRPITSTIHLAPEEKAGVHLVVELFDVDALDSWSDADHARLFETLAG